LPTSPSAQRYSAFRRFDEFCFFPLAVAEKPVFYCYVLSNKFVTADSAACLAYGYFLYVNN
jgi:hypothetical protein